VVVRRDCLLKAGSFNGSLDKDMFLRVARKFKIGATEKPLAVHNKTNRPVKGMKGPLKREKVYKDGFGTLDFWEKTIYFRKFRQKCSSHFASAGKKHLQEKKYSLSVNFYLEALRRYPFKLKYLKGLIKASVFMMI